MGVFFSIPHPPPFSCHTRIVYSLALVLPPGIDEDVHGTDPSQARDGGLRGGEGQAQNTEFVPHTLDMSVARYRDYQQEVLCLWTAPPASISRAGRGRNYAVVRQRHAVGCLGPWFYLFLGLQRSQSCGTFTLYSRKVYVLLLGVLEIRMAASNTNSRAMMFAGSIAPCR